MPLHAAIYSLMVRAVRHEYGDDLNSGDVFIANHPYETGAAHVPDLTALAPIFHDGQLVAFCGNIAHKADFGGCRTGQRLRSGHRAVSGGPPVAAGAG